MNKQNTSPHHTLSFERWPMLLPSFHLWLIVARHRVPVIVQAVQGHNLDNLVFPKLWEL